jgi:hypothetical protein
MDMDRDREDGFLQMGSADRPSQGGVRRFGTVAQVGFFGCGPSLAEAARS